MKIAMRMIYTGEGVNIIDSTLKNGHADDTAGEGINIIIAPSKTEGINIIASSKTAMHADDAGEGIDIIIAPSKIKAIGVVLLHSAGEWSTPWLKRKCRGGSSE